MLYRYTPFPHVCVAALNALVRTLSGVVVIRAATSAASRDEMVSGRNAMHTSVVTPDVGVFVNLSSPEATLAVRFKPEFTD